MSLLNYYNENNMIIEEGLTVRYATYKKMETVKEQIGVSYTKDSNGKVTSTSPIYGDRPYYWTVVYRYATKQYRYVGMDYSTARQCAAAKSDYYTRATKQQTDRTTAKYVQNQDNITQTMCQATITPTHIGGGIYDVVINVNESDSVVVKGSGGYGGSSDNDEEGEVNKNVNWHLPNNLATLFNYIVCQYEENFNEGTGASQSGQWTIRADELDSNAAQRQFEIVETSNGNGTKFIQLKVNGYTYQGTTISEGATTAYMRYGDSPVSSTYPYLATCIKATSSGISNNGKPYTNTGVPGNTTDGVGTNSWTGHDVGNGSTMRVEPVGDNVDSDFSDREFTLIVECNSTTNKYDYSFYVNNQYQGQKSFSAIQDEVTFNYGGVKNPYQVKMYSVLPSSDFNYDSDGNITGATGQWIASTNKSISDEYAVGVAGEAFNQDTVQGSPTSLNLPNAIIVDGYAFNGCSSLATVKLPNVQEIQTFAFKDCTSITSIDFPLCEYIYANAFQGCTSLTTATIQMASMIGDEAFSGCTSLTTVKASSATTIGELAFDGCTSLTTVELGSATTIKSQAFNDCSAITEIKLPMVKSIGDQAFYGAESLEKLTLGKMTKAQVNAGYLDWGIQSGCVVTCYDGTLTIE